jgi:ankyrin repeat protein
MRGTKFLESTWVGDNDALEQQLESFFNEQEAKGLAPNATPMNDTDNFGHTALITAVYRGHVHTIRFLCKEHIGGQQADTNASNMDGWTALHIAVHRQNLPAVIALLDQLHDFPKGPLNVNAMNKNCWTPIHFAAYYGNIGMVQRLLNAGAVVDSLNSTTQTPLVLACERDHSEVAKVLAKLGANVFKVSSSGQTPVEFSAENGWQDELRSAARVPNPPDGVPYASRIGPRSCRVTWGRTSKSWSADVDGYRIDQALLESGKKIRWKNVYNGNRDRVSCDLHGLRPATWYIFRACCHSWAGWSIYGGSSQPIQTKFDKPEPPSLPRMVRDGVTTMRVEWDAGRDNGAALMYYELQYKLSTFQGLWMTWKVDNATTEIPHKRDTTQMTVKELMPRQKYRFRARARNRIGWSPWGHGAVFSTLDAGQIALISPTATTQWRRGTSVAIQFEATETIKGDVIIELFRGTTRVSEIHNGNRSLPVKFDNTTLTYHGVFTWHVPTIARVGRTYRVKIRSLRYANVMRQSAEFCILSETQGPVDGVHCRKLNPQALAKAEAMSEEEMELQREIQLEFMEEKQKELFEEMKVELVAEVKLARRRRAAAERERLEAERDEQFKEKMRKGKAKRLKGKT